MTETADLVVINDESVNEIPEIVVEETKREMKRKQNGFREIGPRKARLLLSVFKEITRLNTLGINHKEVLKTLKNYKGAKTNTKNLSGVISDLKTFK